MRLYGIWRFNDWLADYVPYGFHRDREFAEGAVEACNRNADGRIGRWHVIETGLFGAARAVLKVMWLAGWRCLGRYA